MDNELVKTNIIEGGSTDLTPIEIMLDVDENGETTARKLYEFLGLSSKHFSEWIKRNLLDNPFALENTDFVRVPFEGETPTGGKITRDDYKLTATFAKKLCMTSQSERGEQARNYFIKVEDKLKEKSKNETMVLPQDYEQALESLLLQVKTNNKLLKENENLKSTIKEDEPKIELYERLMNGKNAIEMNQVAKTLGVIGLGRNNLFKVLRSIGVLMSNNVPYQKYLENRGLFIVKFVPIQIGEHIENKPKTLVTAKGLEFIHKKLKDHKYINSDNNYMIEN